MLVPSWLFHEQAFLFSLPVVFKYVCLYPDHSLGLYALCVWPVPWIFYKDENWSGSASSVKNKPTKWKKFLAVWHRDVYCDKEMVATGALIKEPPNPTDKLPVTTVFSVLKPPWFNGELCHQNTRWIRVDESPVHRRGLFIFLLFLLKYIHNFFYCFLNYMNTHTCKFVLCIPTQ